MRKNSCLLGGLQSPPEVPNQPRSTRNNQPGSTRDLDGCPMFAPANAFGRSRARFSTPMEAPPSPCHPEEPTCLRQVKGALNSTGHRGLDGSPMFALANVGRKSRATRISCYVALDRTACAPFREERRMHCINATKSNRKSGGSPSNAFSRSRVRLFIRRGCDLIRFAAGYPLDPTSSTQWKRPPPLFSPSEAEGPAVLRILRGNVFRPERSVLESSAVPFGLSEALPSETIALHRIVASPLTAPCILL